MKICVDLHEKGRCIAVDGAWHGSVNFPSLGTNRKSVKTSNLLTIEMQVPRNVTRCLIDEIEKWNIFLFQHRSYSNDHVEGVLVDRIFEVYDLS